jgi:hypothetical protein
MQTLRTLSKQIEEIQKTNPEYMDLPLVYQSIEEFIYHKRHQLLLPIEVENFNGYYLKIVDKPEMKPNCITIT